MVSAENIRAFCLAVIEIRLTDHFITEWMKMDLERMRAAIRTGNVSKMRDAWMCMGSNTNIYDVLLGATWRFPSGVPEGADLYILRSIKRFGIDGVEPHQLDALVALYLK